MNKPRCSDIDHIDFLVAAPAARCQRYRGGPCQPRRPNAPVYDAFARLLHCLPSDTTALWWEGAS